MIKENHFMINESFEENFKRGACQFDSEFCASRGDKETNTLKRSGVSELDDWINNRHVQTR